MVTSVIILLMAVCACDTVQMNYTWPQYNDEYDCMVGIAIDNIPISTGVFIYPHYVLTSANPLEQYYNFGTDPYISISVRNLMVYGIKGAYDQSERLKFPLISGNKGGRRLVWVKTGFSKVISPVHDLAVLNLDDGRRPFYYCKYGLNSTRTICCAIEYTGWPTHFLNILKPEISPVIAAFGFVDEEHIKENDKLEIVDFAGENVWEKCDEWIPREWGYFICVRNIYKFTGVSSGAGLFYDGTLVGIGSFSVDKGNDSILVFTDLAMYRFKLGT